MIMRTSINETQASCFSIAGDATTCCTRAVCMRACAGQPLFELLFEVFVSATAIYAVQLALLVHKHECIAKWLHVPVRCHVSVLQVAKVLAEYREGIWDSAARDPNDEMIRGNIV